MLARLVRVLAVGLLVVSIATASGCTDVSRVQQLEQQVAQLAAERDAARAEVARRQHSSQLPPVSSRR